MSYFFKNFNTKLNQIWFYSDTLYRYVNGFLTFDGIVNGKNNLYYYYYTKFLLLP